MAHAHQLQNRSYYPNSSAQSGPGGQPSGQLRPRWNQQSGQGVPRQQSTQYSSNYRGQTPRGGLGAPRAQMNRQTLNVSQGMPRAGQQAQPRAQGQPRAPSGQQFKYQNNTRNLPSLSQSVPSFQSQQVSQPQQGIAVPGQEPLTASMLAEANPQDQKQMLGERLFPVIASMHPDMAGKITGMLLEIDNSELLHMLEHNASLKAKVDEAVAVLQAHHAKEMAAVQAQIKKD